MPKGTRDVSLAWMPATRYQRFWHSMPAFALPSFSDGRIRLNLIGRELHGKVSLENYQRAVATIENLIRACIDPATGESAVDFVEYPAPGDPCKFTSTQADLIVVWKGAATCLEHPSLGRIGPVPYRRTGGHTGRFGMAYIGADTGLAGDQGIRSAFDVVPTIIQLLGHPPDRPFNGTSLLSDPQSDDDASALGAVSAG
jgi:hypothetical protein